MATIEMERKKKLVLMKYVCMGGRRSDGVRTDLFMDSIILFYYSF